MRSASSDPPGGIFDSDSIFATLAPATRARLAAGAVVRTFAAGSTLFRAGTRIGGIYLIVSGSIRIVRSRHGRQYVVHTEEAGGTLGEVACFEGGPLPATAVAIVESRCVLLRESAIRAALEADQAVAWLFLGRLSARVRGLVERLDRRSTQHIPSRLAAYLIERSDVAGPGPFTLGMTQAALAEELGTVREAVVRALAHLCTAGVLHSAGRGRYAIGDRAALAVIGSE